MKLVADSDGRLACKELFPPGKPFAATRLPDGSIRLVGLGPDEVAVVEPVRTAEGFLMLPVQIDRRTISAAIRADRDALN